MKQQLLFLFFLSLVSTDSFSQIKFQKVIGNTYDVGNCVRQTNDGGYIIGVRTGSNGAGSTDYSLIKTNATGDTLWTKTYGGIDDDWPSIVQQTSDGGYIISGYTESFGAGFSDILLIKTNSNGNLLWSKTYGGNGFEYGNSVQQTSDGGYIIGAFRDSTGTGFFHIYVIKTDVNGSIVWAKNYGGANNDWCSSVQQTADGGYIIVGATKSFGVGSNDVYLSKTNSSGNVLWTKTYGGVADDFGYSAQQTSTGEFIITGYTNSFGAGSSDVYLIKADANGNLIWSRTFGNTNVDKGNCVQQTIDGGYIITGVINTTISSDEIYLIKTDGNGDSLWTKRFGGSSAEYGAFVQQTNDDGFIITGTSSSFSAGGYVLTYMIKTDQNGNSGCHQFNTTTFVSTPSTQVTTPSPTVSTGGNSSIPLTVEGSGSTTINSLCRNVGIEENILNNEIISIYPNPASKYFTLSIKSLHEEISISILNLFGEILQHIKLNSDKITVNVKEFPSGIYFVILNAREKQWSQKLLIE